MKHVLCVAAMAASMALAACVPFPHMEQVAPDISGTVLESGVPIKGAAVSQCVQWEEKNRSCAKQVEAVTDASGRFGVMGARRLTAFAFLYGDPIYAFGIAVTAGGGSLKWSSGGIGYMPSAVVLHCVVGEKLVCVLQHET